MIFLKEYSTFTAAIRERHAKYLQGKLATSLKSIYKGLKSSFQLLQKYSSKILYIQPRKAFVEERKNSFFVFCASKLTERKPVSFFLSNKRHFKVFYKRPYA